MCSDRRRLGAAIFALALGLAASRPCSAQGSPEAHAAAVRLFEEGTALVDQGKCDLALPKLLESIRLEPGIGAHLNAGECLERTGDHAAAAKAFREAEKLANTKKDSRAALARSRAEAVEAKLPAAPVTTAPAETAPPTAPIAPTAPVDPVTPAPSNTSPSPLVLAPAEEPARGGTQRTLGIVTAGTGAVALTIGAIFGMVAKSDNDDAAELCPRGNDACGPGATALTSDARSEATVSTIGFVAGTLLLAGGLVLYFTAPSSRPPPSANARGLVVTF